MNTTYNPTRTIAEVMLEARKRFQDEFGRLLTEEEAVQLTDEIRAEIREDDHLSLF